MSLWTKPQSETNRMKATLYIVINSTFHVTLLNKMLFNIFSNSNEEIKLLVTVSQAVFEQSFSVEMAESDGH